MKIALISGRVVNLRVVNEGRGISDLSTGGNEACNHVGLGLVINNLNNKELKINVGVLSNN